MTVCNLTLGRWRQMGMNAPPPFRRTEPRSRGAEHPLNLLHSGHDTGVNE